ncbi:PDZ domain-containing protein [Paraglaciecola sp. 25GB23A]|uniref:M61 family metallopeptidase n=1 Tax=Paraglaciecola sp. 25GB23A TaxID=3156068 RepID=UPI0032AF6D96
MTHHPHSVHYDLNVSSIAGHLIDVVLTINSPSKIGQTLSLPAWIPGSYMIRDFAKHIVKLQAHTDSGQIIPVTKSDKQTWHLPVCESIIIVTYQVYAYDLSVRGAYINEQYAFFNGSNIFLQVESQSDLPCSLSLNHCNYTTLTADNVATTMPVFELDTDKASALYQADNYAELIDHPVLIGQFDKQLFAAGEIEFELVFAGGHQSDMQRITKDLAQICQQHLSLFAAPAPIQRYLFITLLTDAAFGGLEHRASTALMFARNDLAHANEPAIPSEPYRTFLSLCSHEFFHTWHVKRIRPIELVQGSLATETYTEQLWIYEGITSYYDDLLLQRSKVISIEDYLVVMGQNLTRLERNKGRLKQSVAASSYDAWTKFYKQDESAINHIVSYYNKGAVIAMCLDLLIRQQSHHQYSLDNVMRYLWETYGRTDTPTPPTVIHDILIKQFDIDLSEFLAAAVHGTQDLPTAELLTEFGIRLNYRTRKDNNDKGGTAEKKGIKHDFGASFKAKETGIEISQVVEQSSAYDAGILVGDIVIALDSWQIGATNVLTMLDRLDLSRPCVVSLLRDKRFIQVILEVRPAIHDTIYLSIENPEKMRAWLN